MRRRNGITLIEILVSMAVLALLTVILHSVFTVSLRGWKKADNLLGVTSTARVALERMEREISQAIVEPGNTLYCLGFDRLSPSGWRTGSVGDEFYFIAPLNPAYDEGSDLCEVGYWAGTDKNADPELKRFYVLDDRKQVPPVYFDFNFATGSSTSSHDFALNITDLQFVFFDRNNTPFEQWDSRNTGSPEYGLPPAKIKITITVTSGKGTAATNPDFISKNFSTVVTIPQ